MLTTTNFYSIWVLDFNFAKSSLFKFKVDSNDFAFGGELLLVLLLVLGFILESG